MGTGLVISGKTVPVPGIDVTNYLDDPALRLDPGDCRQRTSRERSWVRLVVLHTTGGIPGGKDLRPQMIQPGLGKSTGGGQRIVASWTHDKKRPGGSHIVVDQDGTCYCCADLVDVAAYHAERANGCSVGIEVVQGHAKADLYQGQLERAAVLALWICRLMPVPIQWQVPRPYTGHPLVRFQLSLANDPVPLGNVTGIVGHRDLTATRGQGDPGDAMMMALVREGCEELDFASGEDIAVWKLRQQDLGLVGCDGVPGPRTAEILKKIGHPDGIWRLPAPPPAPPTA